MSEQPPLGLAGRIAAAFIQSKLTILIVVSSLLLGALAVLKLPREEDPQIKVPMFDVLVPFPGADSKEVEQRVVDVGERKLWEIPGVKYVYSTSAPNMALFIVRFKVGENPDEAMTRVYTKVFSNRDLMPPGAGEPLVKPHSINDVPILTLTLSGQGLDGYALRREAAALRQEISAVPDVSRAEIIGGRRREFLVHLDPARMAARRITPLELAGVIGASNVRLPSGRVDAPGRDVLVQTDSLIRSVDELEHVVVGVSGGRPVFLQDVATVLDGPDDEEREVFTRARGGPEEPAATIAVSKRGGSNATVVARAVLARIARVKAALAPHADVAVTRDYGKTAENKSDELLYHMLLATLSVAALIGLFLGAREALVVLVAVPVTLALTLLVYYLAGYTLNRITLFALIFSIGILVDDAIVVVENVHRHYSMRDGRSLWRLTVEAVDEVGNPTLLATWTVIAAILPMAFVRGLMGPYMRPIPVGASFAMLFSVAIAFIVSPWAFAHILNVWKPNEEAEGAGAGRLDSLYRAAMRRLLGSGRLQAVLAAATALLLAASVALIPFKRVIVKMLPFDNKNSFDIVLDMPEGSSLNATRDVAEKLAAAASAVPEVRRVTLYLGTSAPFDFNGLVRHYFLRRSPDRAEVEVNLSPKEERRRQSHDIAKALRPELTAIARAAGAHVQLAEVPPGPPVLSPLVLEFYAPSAALRNELARRAEAVLEKDPGVTDVDTYVASPQPLRRLAVDREKATLNGIPPLVIARTVSLALGGMPVGLAHVPSALEPVDIVLRLSEAMRRTLGPTRSIDLYSRNGTPIPLGALTRVEPRQADEPIYHKNLLPVSYVLADVSGREESPIYAILSLRGKMQAMADSMGVPLVQYYDQLPHSSREVALKWDGEWQITYEVFRDLGVAFALVLVLIYVLVVGWFENFAVPLVIMAPIPLTLIGILPAHWAMHAFFTATSMIGFIAGAGIVVRNSIILVDFIQLRLKQGLSLEEAVIDAGAVRFRPILLTAAAVVVGAGVILFDPIFQGMAIALMAGEVATTLLAPVVVPVFYYALARRNLA
jgi:multidrug efflux pump subunit AcrB